MSSKEVTKSKAPAANNWPVLNATLGILALIFIAFFANWLMAISAAGNRTLDLTKDKVHTLTEGTKSILTELEDSEAEVVINYYATRDAEFMPRNLELYMKKVDSFLKRYKALAGDNLRIVNLDPKPDTDAEDSANLDGIAGQSLNDENLYLGISVSSLDQKATIPFLSPESETKLEYQLSSAIARVARTDKPTLGLMTPFPMSGAPAAPGQPPSQPFVVYQQLGQIYELTDIGMAPTAEQLEGLAAVLVIHPFGITPTTEYLLDQYLLAGGTVVAALDAFSITAQQYGGDPRLGQQGMPTSSSFSNDLLNSWGVSFISDEVLADGTYRTRLGRGDSTSALSLTKNAMPQKDSLITNDLNNLFFVLAGAFTAKGQAGLEHTSLLRSTTAAGFVDSRRAAQLDPALLGQIRTDEKAYDLALHVKGNFKTAFPDGNPADQAKDNAEAEAEAEKAEQEEPTISLTESTKPGNVFLIADTDFLGNGIAYRQVMGGLFTPQGDNEAFLFNILDQVTGSKHLIGSRSRGDSRRPFTVVQDMETQFEKEFGEKLEKKQTELDEISQRLGVLIEQQQSNGQVALEGEVKEEYNRSLAKQVEARKELRELQKELRRDKDALATRYTLANVFLIPVLVILIGLGVFLKRRLATSAR